MEEIGESRNQKKWEGKVFVNLKSSTPSADEIFHLLIRDFFSFHKWIPTLTTCYGVQGISGQPGCIRYIGWSRTKSSSSSSSNGCDNNNDESTVVTWCTEKLLAVDFVERSFSYDIVDGNLGFYSYVSTMKVIEAKEENGGCLIEWSFEVDPIQGLKFENLVSIYNSNIQLLATTIESNFL